MTLKEYPLGEWEAANFAKYAKGQKHGTIIHFEGIKQGIRAVLIFSPKSSLFILNFLFLIQRSTSSSTMNGSRTNT